MATVDQQNKHGQDGPLNASGGSATVSGAQSPKPKPGAVIGLALCGVGGGGALAYLGWLVPVELVLSILMIFVGFAIVLMEAKVGDQWELRLPGGNLVFSASSAEIVIVVVEFIKKWAPRIIGPIAIIFSVPNLTVGEVELLFQKGPENEPALVPIVRENGASPPAPAGRERTRSSFRSATNESFDLAVQWLQRPHLMLGLGAQLRLRSLYLQGTVGDASDALLPGKGALHDAQMSCWRSLGGMTRSEAKQRMPCVLADMEPAFASSRPDLATLPEPSSSMPHVAMQIAARRVPADIDARIFQAQRRVLRAAAAATLLSLVAVLRSLKARRPGAWRVLFAGCAAANGVATLYSAALAHGLPAELQASVLQRLRGPDFAVAAGPADPAMVLVQLLARTFRPRVARPILQE